MKIGLTLLCTLLFGINLSFSQNKIEIEYFLRFSPYKEKTNKKYCFINEQFFKLKGKKKIFCSNSEKLYELIKNRQAIDTIFRLKEGQKESYCPNTYKLNCRIRYTEWISNIETTHSYVISIPIQCTNEESENYLRKILDELNKVIKEND